jgi:hypothetical protein
MTTLVWDTTSQWQNPHFSTLYSQPVKLEADGFTKTLEFHVSNRGEYRKPDYRLMLITRTYRYSEIDYVWWDLGSFVDTLDNGIACANIKRYAQYVVDGYIESWNLQHCPSAETVDDVDENLNPVPRMMWVA